MRRLLLLLSLVTTSAFGMLMARDLAGRDGGDGVQELWLWQRTVKTPAKRLEKFCDLTDLHIILTEATDISASSLSLHAMGQLRFMRLQGPVGLSLSYAFIKFCVNRGLYVDVSGVDLDAKTKRLISRHAKQLFITE